MFMKKANRILALMLVFLISTGMILTANRAG